MIITVTLNAADQTGLSDVREVRYAVNGGLEQAVLGNAAKVEVPLDGEGTATVAYYAVDNAGNFETAKRVELLYDTIAPTVSHRLDPDANADGWSKQDTTVQFSATDTGSGVDSVSRDVVVATETAGQLVEGRATDKAGNVGRDSVTVKLDKTAPTITGAVTGGTLGKNGYYTGQVTVSFTCGDALSGIAVCPDPVTLTADGDHSVTRSASDKAGNTSFASIVKVSIDSTKPTITVSGVKASYTLGEAVNITCSATDAGSGVDANGCTVTTSGGNTDGVGTVTYTATATDNAGNVQTAAGTYNVVYAWGGFLQPINDTAHQVGSSTSIFKGGSTVPAKFQLKKADGTVVYGGVAQWLTPAKGSATSATVDETAYSDTSTSGSTYKYDSTTGQYQYNWSTKGVATGFYYRIGVKLEDGRTYYVHIGLR